MAFYSFLFALFVVVSFSVVFGQQSPEIVAKWRTFVESLSPALRKKFDALHAEAGKLEQGTVQKRVEQFVAELSPEQKKTYSEIQQRDGGGGQREAAPPAKGAKGGKEKEREKGGEARKGAGNGGGEEGMAEKLDRWAARTDLAQGSRDALRQIKDLYIRKGADPTEQCERIQRLLKGIGAEDRRKMNLPERVLTMDCRAMGGGAPHNLVRGIGQ